jgi:hypothetical protein
MSPSALPLMSSAGHSAQDPAVNRAWWLLNGEPMKHLVDEALWTQKSAVLEVLKSRRRAGKACKSLNLVKSPRALPHGGSRFRPLFGPRALAPELKFNSRPQTE